MGWRSELPEDTVRARSTFGFPIEGDFSSSGHSNAEQWPLDRFLELFNAVVGDPFIEKVTWTQYTPYFNDGEVCEFSVHTPEVYPQGWEAKRDEGDYESYLWEIESSEHPILGGEAYEWRAQGNGPKQYVSLGYRGEHEETWRRCSELGKAMNKGHFDVVLQTLFGDHTEVTAYRGEDGQVRIRTEGYSHD